MKRSFKKEYDFLTPMHQRLFRKSIMDNYKWTTKQAFYKLIRGERRVSEAEYKFIIEKLQFYFQIQKETGRIFLELQSELQ